MPDVNASQPLRGTWGESFREFFEAHGRLSRDEFCRRFKGAFLVTESSTDPETWSRARLLRVERRGGRIELGARALAAHETGVVFEEPILVGRLASNDVVLPEMSVSKRHAALKRGDRQWWVEDLGSSNGTWLEGAEIPPRRAVRIARAPARLSFGEDARFTFFTSETLHEFMAEIRRRTEPASEPPALLPDDEDDPVAPPARWNGLDRVAVGEDSSCAVTADLPLGAQLADTDCHPADVIAMDEKRLDDALSSLASLATVIARVEAHLEDAAAPVVLFSGGPPAELEQAGACVEALRSCIVAIVVTLTIGDRKPFDLFRRRRT